MKSHQFIKRLITKSRIRFLSMIFALISGVFLIAPLFKPIIALCENGFLNAASPLDAYALAGITLAITADISGIQRQSRIPDQPKFLSRIVDLGDPQQIDKAM